VKKNIFILFLCLFILNGLLIAALPAGLSQEQIGEAVLMNLGLDSAYRLLELDSGSYREYPAFSGNWQQVASNRGSTYSPSKAVKQADAPQARDPEPFTAVLNSLNSQNFPFVYANVAVSNNGEGVPDLTEENFNVYENGVLQTNFFDVTPPEAGGGQRLADIVFCLDVSGSMSGAITSVKNNMLSFIQGLEASGIDYRIGFITFGDIYYVYNSHNLYADYTEIINLVNGISLGEHGIGSGDDYPENQLGSMAESALFNYRPGAQKVVIMLTDATSHAADWATPWTVNTLINERLLPNNIAVYPVFYTGDSAQQNQYVPIAQATNPGGTYYDIYANFNAIINEIGNLVENTYVIRYRTNNPTYDGVLRNVEYQVSFMGSQAVATGSYQPGAAPQIERTAETLGWHTQAWPENTVITLSCLVTDLVEPFTTQVRLFFRQPAEVHLTMC
jgi:uncharacterized protein YegL